MEKHTKRFAEMISTEMGKPVSESAFEVKKSAGHCKFYAENLERFLKMQ
jgi:succinate-semialdehyde dehydrogenase/glutarate-semialdehyde dehydrogenase